MGFFVFTHRTLWIVSLFAIALVAAAACAPAAPVGTPVGSSSGETEATPHVAEHDDTDASHHEGGLWQGDGVLKLSIAATDGSAWGYTPNVVEVPAGQQVALTLINHGAIEHDMEIPTMPAEHVQVAKGEHQETDAGHHSSSVVAAHAMVGRTVTVTFTPTKAGAYEIACTLPGHKQAGMVGTLVVKASAASSATSGHAEAGEPTGSTPGMHK